MNSRTLKQLWVSLFKRATQAGSKANRQGLLPKVDPFTAGLRIDLSVPSGAGKEIVASQFVWVSPTGRTSPARTLRVLLLPN